MRLVVNRRLWLIHTISMSSFFEGRLIPPSRSKKRAAFDISKKLRFQRKNIITGREPQTRPVNQAPEWPLSPTKGPLTIKQYDCILSTELSGRKLFFRQDRRTQTYRNDFVGGPVHHLVQFQDESRWNIGATPTFLFPIGR